MAKKIFYDEDARQRLLAGAEALYNAVKTTMGPKGRNVIIANQYGNPTVTHDGVTVAKGVDLEVNEETLGYKVGADLIIQAASKMNDVVGDGTTTVTVLTYHILKEANKLIAAGHNPMQLRAGLERAALDVITILDNESEDISENSKRVAQVATISAGDSSIGKLIADVIEKVGKKGAVAVEPGQGLELESEVVEGFTFDKGLVSTYMATDTTRVEATYEKPAIIVTDRRVSSVQEFLPLLEKLAQSGKKDLVLIADEVEGEALTMLVLNKLKGVFNTVAVKAPAFGDRRKEILEDIATLTGATVISGDRGMTFENVTLEVVGSARRVIVTQKDTTIVEGNGSQDNVTARIEEIKAKIENADNSYDKEALEKRAAALQGKVAVIKVGGVTETEIEEKKYRVDDAVAAAKAALAAGVVPGGGVTLVALSDTIKSTDAGEQLLKVALLQPFRTLLTNSGLNADEWLPKVQASNKHGYGVNVIEDKPTSLVDLNEEGVIDPVRVTKEAILNAVSIAGTVMTMGALVVEVPHEEPQQSQMSL